MSNLARSIEDHWTAIRPLLTVRTESDYESAVQRLNQLIDEVGDDESHPLYDFLDALGAQIHAYEEQHYPLPEASGPEVLRFLMDEHGLHEADLPELGSADVVVRILAGAKDLNVGQIRSLAERFHVSPAVFI